MKPEDIADFRRAVRAHFCERPTAALTPGTVLSRLRVEWSNQGVDYVEACEFLVDLGQLKRITDPMGGPQKYYQATATGIIAYERDG